MNSTFHKSPLILIVDDEKTMRLILRRTMERQGYRIAEATDGQECLQVCQEIKPDMILLDGMMPRMDGFTCCAKLHNLLADDCPPVLMITVLEDQKSVDSAFEVGATDYVTKPIHWAVLLQRVRRILQSHWAMVELQHQIERERLLTEQLESANRELERFATMDYLTQVANRYRFDRYTDREWLRLTREQLPISLILCDLDFFKAYNDTYGHQAGDQCLKQVAEAIKNCARRPADLAARYGGEEFALVLPNTEAQGAIQVAETIRSEVRKKAIIHCGSSISEYLTLSLGVTSLIPSSGSSPDQLVLQADLALYQAKSAGRDRVILYSSGDSAAPTDKTWSNS
jgi:diguanylate cyclase (GGDEF)-like protein